MNQAILIGRLTDDPEIRYTKDETPIASYTLAVDRMGNGTDFIRCKAWSTRAEFAKKYLHKGTKIAVTGRIETGSYKNRDGHTVYTTEVVVNTHDFCEKKEAPAEIPETDDFVTVPEGIDETLPFN